MRDLLRLLRLFRPYALWMTGGIGLGSLVVVTNVGLLALSGWFIAAMALAGLGHFQIEVFAPAAGIRALAILRTGGRYGERLITHEATFRLLAQLRVWFFERLEPLAPARLQSFRSGDLLSRIRSDIDSLDDFYLRIIAPTVAAAISATIILCVLACFVPFLALVEGTALLLAGIGLPLLAQRLGSRPGRRAVAIGSDLHGTISDTSRGLGELLIHGAQGRQTALIAALSRSLVAERRTQAGIAAGSTALSGLAAHIAMWSAIVVTIPLVAAGSLPSPDLAMIALLVLASFEVVAPLPSAFQAVGGILAAARRIFELVDGDPTVVDPPGSGRVPMRFDLHIEALRMRYAPDAPWAIDGVDLALAEGHSVGIVGPSGSGKTSLGNVLLRFWDYQGGHVAIGDVPLRSIRGEAVRSLIAVVAQQTHLFNASIRDNLLLARPEARDDELLAALASADIADEVLSMPEGLDTLVGEIGARLSGGQARRVAIARAFLKNAPILLLDEPTEGLDPASEKAVLHALGRLMRGRTTLLITHRPQALSLVDKIITLPRQEC